MRINKIIATDRYKHIDFKHIVNRDNSAVLTPTGWSTVRASGFVKRAISKKITTPKSELICAEDHILLTHDGTSVKAKEIDQSVHRLMTYGNKATEFKIMDGGEEDFYDIRIDSPHWWFTSGVVSHNSILLCNNAVSSLKGIGRSGKPGQDVLLITFELDTIKTAMRCLGAATDVALDDIPEKRSYVERVINQMRQTYGKRFVIFEWPPDECSVTHVYALLDNLKRTENFKPDVVILDYMDLMVSRNQSYNKDDYTRQKHVANEIRGLAKNEDVLVFTATQTNRSGASGDGVVDLTNAAESYAKQFSLDYVVSLNQSDSQRQSNPPRISLYIAKNRNGPKHQTVNCVINYNTMLVREEL